jgi:uncharacterized protein (TIGR00369 family)
VTTVAAKPAGLELMELIRNGVLPPPPAAVVLGLDIVDLAEGEVTFGFTADERYSNGATTHGGILAAVADFAVSTAVLSRLDAGTDVVTTNLSVSYLRPVPHGGRYRCTGRVVHLGRTLGHAEAVMADDAGREVVRATATLHVR